MNIGKTHSILSATALLAASKPSENSSKTASALSINTAYIPRGNMLTTGLRDTNTHASTHLNNLNTVLNASPTDNNDATNAPDEIPPGPSLANVTAAAERMAGKVLRTPLVKLNGDYGAKEIYLKLENLQSIGAFKIRGAGNLMQSLPESAKQKGVWTASAGNMAQGVAAYAKDNGMPCTIVVPADAPANKLEKIKALDGNIIKVPRYDWFQVLKQRHYDGLEGEFIHPFADNRVMAGNGCIALEILEDLPDVDTIIAPYGGGGLSCGIGAAIAASGSNAKVYACEPETAASLSASFKAGKPTQIDAKPSFVDGMGSPFVFEEMWPLAERYLAGSIEVSLKEIAEAVKILLEKNHIVAEGAGAASVGAAIKEGSLNEKIVCVISGGNIDTAKLIKILNNEVPNN